MSAKIAKTEIDIKVLHSVENPILSKLPEDVLRYIFLKCRGKDLGYLSRTCRRFRELLNEDSFWRHKCFKDFKLSNPDLGPFKSFRSLYTNLLHKYGWMCGVYLTRLKHYGGLAEVRYKSGSLECIHWEQETKSSIEVPLKGETLFLIRGDVDTPKNVCFYDDTTGPNHKCDITFNKVRGTIYQTCLQPKKHQEQLLRQNNGTLPWSQHTSTFSHFRLLLLYNCLERSLQYTPILLPSLDDVPEKLRLSDGSLPSHLIAPGLFKGFIRLQNVSGVQILCFKYKNQCEVLGLKVAVQGDDDDNGIFLKIFIRHFLFPTLDEQSSFDMLLELEHEYRLPTECIEQPFRVPEGCKVLCESVPDTCQARYNGFMRSQQKSYFMRVHIIIFSDDLVGVLMLDCQRYFQTYHRIHQKFTANILTSVETAI